MAWVEGTFATSSVVMDWSGDREAKHSGFWNRLTPSMLSHPEAPLTLKISLCCGYLFKGAALLSEASSSSSSPTLYDQFLEVLLEATPFRTWDREEKRALFPAELAIVYRSSERVNKTAHTSAADLRQDHASVSSLSSCERGTCLNDSSRLFTGDALKNDPTEAELKEQEGDGDVLLLVTGERIPSLALRRLSDSLRPVDGVEEGAFPPAVEMNLKITRAALRCKCPHTLLVRPSIPLYADVLRGTLAIRGLGSHCIYAAAAASHASSPLIRREAVKVLNETGRAFSFGLDYFYRSLNRTAGGEVSGGGSGRLQLQPLPSGAQVEWLLHELSLVEQEEDDDDEARPTAVPSLTLAQWEAGVEAGLRGWRIEEKLVAHQTHVIPPFYREASGMPLAYTSPYFDLDPHVVYRITARLRLREDDAKEEEEEERSSRTRHFSSSSFIPPCGNRTACTAAESLGARTVLESSGLVVLRPPFSTLSDEFAHELPSSATQRTPHFGIHRRLTLNTKRGKAVEALLTGLTPPAWRRTQALSSVYKGFWVFLDHPTGERVYSSRDGAPVEVRLRPGLNSLGYFVEDVDGVCPVEVVERHEIWALQSRWHGERSDGRMTQPLSLLTACGSFVPLQAETVGAVVERMKATGDDLLSSIVLLRGSSPSSMAEQEGKKDEGDEEREGRLLCRQHLITSISDTILKNNNTLGALLSASNASRRIATRLVHLKNLAQVDVAEERGRCRVAYGDEALDWMKRAAELQKEIRERAPSGVFVSSDSPLSRSHATAISLEDRRDACALLLQLDNGTSMACPVDSSEVDHESLGSRLWDGEREAAARAVASVVHFAGASLHHSNASSSPAASSTWETNWLVDVEVLGEVNDQWIDPEHAIVFQRGERTLIRLVSSSLLIRHREDVSQGTVWALRLPMHATSLRITPLALLARSLQQRALSFTRVENMNEADSVEESLPTVFLEGSMDESSASFIVDGGSVDVTDAGLSQWIHERRGKWLWDAPLVRKEMQVEGGEASLRSPYDAIDFDTHRVPNMEGWLNGSSSAGLSPVLQYYLFDDGSYFIDISGDLHRSRCPPRLVPLNIHVEARPVTPVKPSLKTIYTEKSCMFLESPREKRKDEEVSWTATPCDEVPHHHTDRTTHPPLLRLLSSNDHISRWCGSIPSKEACVRWSASNVAYSTEQVLSIRRCVSPPMLAFDTAPIAPFASFPFITPMRYTNRFYAVFGPEDILRSQAKHSVARARVQSGEEHPLLPRSGEEETVFDAGHPLNQQVLLTLVGAAVTNTIGDHADVTNASSWLEKGDEKGPSIHYRFQSTAGQQYPAVGGIRVHFDLTAQDQFVSQRFLTTAHFPLELRDALASFISAASRPHSRDTSDLLARLEAMDEEALQAWWANASKRLPCRPSPQRERIRPLSMRERANFTAMNVSKRTEKDWLWLETLDTIDAFEQEEEDWEEEGVVEDDAKRETRLAGRLHLLLSLALSREPSPSAAKEEEEALLDADRIDASLWESQHLLDRYCLYPYPRHSSSGAHVEGGPASLPAPDDAFLWAPHPASMHPRRSRTYRAWWWCSGSPHHPPTSPAVLVSPLATPQLVLRPHLREAIEAAVRETHSLQSQDAAVKLQHDHRRRVLSLETDAASAVFPARWVTAPHYSAETNTSCASPDDSPKPDECMFRLQGMCTERSKDVAVMILSPRGVVGELPRYTLQTPQIREVIAAMGDAGKDVVGVLPFCNASFTFSRHPELETKLGYEFEWRCDVPPSPEEQQQQYSCPPGALCAERFEVETVSPTLSFFHHMPSTSSAAGEMAAARCHLTLKNRLSDTLLTESFLVLRLFPSVGGASLAVVSPNAMDRRGVPPVPLPSRGSRTRASPLPPGRRVLVGPSAVLRVDGLSDAIELSTLHWSLEKFASKRQTPLHSHGGIHPPHGHASFSPSSSSSSSSAPLMARNDIHFTPLLFNHTASVNITGMRRAGLYTLALSHPDPRHPNLCPGQRITETFEVFRAALDMPAEERKDGAMLTVCGSTALLRAVPLPIELKDLFFGQWELISVETVEGVVTPASELGSEADEPPNWTPRFLDAQQPEAMIYHLPFGVVSVRWAIYRKSNAINANPVLVDEVSVQLYVLTENLLVPPVYRTLSDALDIFASASMTNVKVQHATAGSSNHPVELVEAPFFSLEEEEALQSAWARRSEEDDFDALESWASHSILSHSVVGRTFTGDALKRMKMSEDRTSSVMARYTRDGARRLTLQHLPVGWTTLSYRYAISPNLFKVMDGKRCPVGAVEGRLWIERRVAGVLVRSPMRHECEAYTEEGSIAMCLKLQHGPTMPEDMKRAEHLVAQHRSRSSSLASSGTRRVSETERSLYFRLYVDNRTRTDVPQNDNATAASQSAPWVSWVDSEQFESLLKEGARAKEFGGKMKEGSEKVCTTPWWTSNATRWSAVQLIASSQGACVRFRVQSTHYLSPSALLHPLFTSLDAASHHRDEVCPSGPSFIPSTLVNTADLGPRLLFFLVEGRHSIVRAVSAPLKHSAAKSDVVFRKYVDSESRPLDSFLPIVGPIPPKLKKHRPEGDKATAGAQEGRPSPTTASIKGSGKWWSSWKRLLRVKSTAPMGVNISAAAREANILGANPVISSVLPTSYHRMVSISSAEDEADEASVLPFLLEPMSSVASLYATVGGAGLTPLEGDDGFDQVSTELQWSGDEGRPVTVDLPLRFTAARRTGGWYTPTHHQFDGLFGTNKETSAVVTVLPSLLAKCLDHTLRGEDIFAYWSELGGEDDEGNSSTSGGDDFSAQTVSWKSYLEASSRSLVACHPRFLSLQPLLAMLRDEGIRNATGAPISDSSTTCHSSSTSFNADASSPATFVSLETLEAQLVLVESALAQQRAWTSDGVDISGYVRSLQEGLRRRRISESQLRELRAQREMEARAGTAAPSSTAKMAPAAGPSFDNESIKRVADVLDRYHSVLAIYTALRPDLFTVMEEKEKRRAGASPTGAPLWEEQAVRFPHRHLASVVSLRLTLPTHPSFVLDKAVNLRLMVNKALLCGIPLPSPPGLMPSGTRFSFQDLTASLDRLDVWHSSENKSALVAQLVSMARASPPPSPFALVKFGKLRIEEVAAEFQLDPPFLSQCQIEGGVPPIVLHVRGARFIVSGRSRLPASLSATQRVQLEEVVATNHAQTPLLMAPRASRGGGAVVPPPAGLEACVAQLLHGASAHFVSNRGAMGKAEAVEERNEDDKGAGGGTTAAFIRLQLSHCPGFRMSERGDEEREDDVEETQRSRWLRITLQRVLAPSSKPTKSPAGTSTVERLDQESSPSSRVSAQWIAFSEAAHPRPFFHADTETGDVSFTMEVVPTLARLYLRDASQQLRRFPRGDIHYRLLDGRIVPSERSLGHSSDDKPAASESEGVDRRGGKEDGVPAEAFLPASHPEFPLVCEGSMKASGLSLGVRLFGDQWSAAVGEEDMWRDGRGSRTGSGVVRSAENAALLNSFTRVKSRPSTSASTSFLGGGGGDLYDSHFLRYVFQDILYANDGAQSRSSHATLWEGALHGRASPAETYPSINSAFRFITKQNASFITIDLPPSLRPERRQQSVQVIAAGASFGGFDELDKVTLRYYNLVDRCAERRFAFLRRFSAVEEIQLSIPGIATQCRGCLTTHPTWFIAGDWSGLVSSRRERRGPSAGSSRKEDAWVRGRASSSTIPSRRTASKEWVAADLREAAVLDWPWSSASPSTSFRYEWLCPRGAFAAARRAYYRLDALQELWGGATAGPAGPFTPLTAGEEDSGPFLRLEVLTHAEVDPSEATLLSLWVSRPVPLASLLRQAVETDAAASSEPMWEPGEDPQAGAVVFHELLRPAHTAQLNEWLREEAIFWGKAAVEDNNERMKTESHSRVFDFVPIVVRPTASGGERVGKEGSLGNATANLGLRAELQLSVCAFSSSSSSSSLEAKDEELCLIVSTSEAFLLLDSVMNQRQTESAAISGALRWFTKALKDGIGLLALFPWGGEGMHTEAGVAVQEMSECRTLLSWLHVGVLALLLLRMGGDAGGNRRSGVSLFAFVRASVCWLLLFLLVAISTAWTSAWGKSVGGVSFTMWSAAAPVLYVVAWLVWWVMVLYAAPRFTYLCGFVVSMLCTRLVLLLLPA